MKKSNKVIKKFKRYMRRTYKNKICALALIGLGVLPAVFAGVGIGLVIGLFIGLPLFFSSENWIN